MTVAWTPKLRGMTFASRTHPNPNHLVGGLNKARPGPCWVPDRVPWPYELEAAWAYALDVSWGGIVAWAEPPNAVEVGYAHATPRMAALMKRARAMFGQRADELDAEVEAAMAVLRLRRSWSAVLVWIAQHGVAFATRVLIAMAPLCTNASADAGLDRASGLVLVESDAYANRELFENVTGWWILRGALAVASEEDYAAARDVADAARAGLSPTYRAAVAFLFPDEPWGGEVVDALLATDYQAAQLAMASVDAADALRLAALPIGYSQAVVLTLIARCGDGAAPVLARALRSSPKKTRKEIAAGLAMIRTREALELWLPFLHEKSLAGPIARAFKGLPDEGKRLLAPLASNEAKALLAKLG